MRDATMRNLILLSAVHPYNPPDCEGYHTAMNGSVYSVTGAVVMEFVAAI